MELKDFIYLAVLAVAALGAYRKGFRQGVWRTRRIWKSLLEKTAPPLEQLPPPEQQPAALNNRLLAPGKSAFFTASTIHASFGKN